MIRRRKEQRKNRGDRMKTRRWWTSIQSYQLLFQIEREQMERKNVNDVNNNQKIRVGQKKQISRQLVLTD